MFQKLLRKVKLVYIKLKCEKKLPHVLIEY